MIRRLLVRLRRLSIVCLHKQRGRSKGRERELIRMEVSAARWGIPVPNTLYIEIEYAKLCVRGTISATLSAYTV